MAGLCNNESCPYRHVNVNPNASACEGFLKGYCADGNEVTMSCHTKAWLFFFNFTLLAELGTFYLSWELVCLMFQISELAVSEETQLCLPHL